MTSSLTATGWSLSRASAFTSSIPPRLLGDIPAATSEDVDVAVKAAKDAFFRSKGQDWAKASGKHRATFLRAIAKRVAERKSELAKLESIDCGKPIDEAEWDLDDVSGCFEYYANLEGCSFGASDGAAQVQH